MTLRSSFDVDSKRQRVEGLQSLASQPGFWDDQATATAKMSELARVEEDIKAYEDLAERVEEAQVLFTLGQEEQDSATYTEAERLIEGLDKDLARLEVRTLLSGEYDEADAICSLQAGEGGTESCDWAAMLMRMFMRWAERRGFDVEVLDMQHGDEAGIKQTTFVVKGRFAYGLLSTEKGVHRLVRISPFDASSRRHTSFASLDVVPAVEEDVEVEIDPNDLKIDVYRSGGPGGQSVNTTDSAVRITHMPTGIVVAVQNERSQLQNRTLGMKILAARLADRARQERQDELEQIRGEQMGIGFGSQIRSYVMHPYQMVKDRRTEVETSNVDAVLDGDIDDFIDAELRRRRARET